MFQEILNTYKQAIIEEENTNFKDSVSNRKLKTIYTEDVEINEKNFSIGKSNYENVNEFKRKSKKNNNTISNNRFFNILSKDNIKNQLQKNSSTIRTFNISNISNASSNLNNNFSGNFNNSKSYNNIPNILNSTLKISNHIKNDSLNSFRTIKSDSISLNKTISIGSPVLKPIKIESNNNIKKNVRNLISDRSASEFKHKGISLLDDNEFNKLNKYKRRMISEFEKVKLKVSFTKASKNNLNIGSEEINNYLSEIPILLINEKFRIKVKEYNEDLIKKKNEIISRNTIIASNQTKNKLSKLERKMIEFPSFRFKLVEEQNINKTEIKPINNSEPIKQNLLTAEEIFKEFVLMESKNHKDKDKQIEDRKENDLKYHINNNFYGNISISSSINQRYQLEEALEKMDELSNFDKVSYLMKPKMYYLQTEEDVVEDLDSEDNSMEESIENDHDDHEDMEYDSENEMKISIKKNKKNKQKNSVDENELEIITVQKKIHLDEVILILKPTNLCYTHNIEHYVLMYKCLNNNDLNESDESFKGPKSRKSKKSTFNAHTFDTIIDIYKINKVLWDEKKLIVNVEVTINDSTKNLLLKVQNNKEGEMLEKSLNHIVNLVKLKALLYKIKKAI